LLTLQSSDASVGSHADTRNVTLVDLESGELLAGHHVAIEGDRTVAVRRIAR